jgi:hypothetical protein
MPTTVGLLASQSGRSVEEVMEACRASGVLVWGGTTPLSDAEAAGVAARLGYAGPPPPPPPPGFGGLPTPPPPGSVPVGTGPYGGVRPVAPTRRPNRAGRIAVSAAVFLAILGGRLLLRDALSDDDGGGGSFEQVVDPLAENAGTDSSQEIDIGDCFLDESTGTPGDVGVEAAVDQVACEVPHDAEAYWSGHVNAAAGAAYPGDQATFDVVSAQCVDHFDDFVGRDYMSSDLDFVALYPSERSWEAMDDRSYVCAVVTMDGSQLTGTVAGSGR